MRRFVQDVASRLDYHFNLGAGTNGEAPNLEDGEQIVSYLLTVDPGITVDAQENDATSVTVWLKDGAVGSEYEVECEWTTNLGRVDVDRFVVRVEGP